MSDTSPAVLWFRRDLRLRDNAALATAAEAGRGTVVPLFVLDPGLWPSAGLPRRLWLARSLRALDESFEGNLLVRHGRPEEQVVEVARAAGARAVHIAGESEPYGRERDARVEQALAAAGFELRRVGTPYVVAPGTVRKGDGEPYTVYSPFARQWEQQARGQSPVPAPTGVSWVRPLPDQGVPEEPDGGGMELPEAGEAAALARWERFRDEALATYADTRNRPDLDGTSSMSAHLKYGEVHPRTLLADLERLEQGAGSPLSEGTERYRAELAWREFYADVVWHRPETLSEHLKPALGGMADEPSEEVEGRFTAWTEGRTGYPFVDAGMRQLRAVGWVHNRVRMVVASFLIKDLHVDWRRGAEFFMQWLRDGDPASNYSGWQWVAGTGTDPAPYYRVFNPVKQGLEHDPAGDYVRRYVPELRDLPGALAHEPWKLPVGYPERIVDHAEERRESLRRYESARR